MNTKRSRLPEGGQWRGRCHKCGAEVVLDFAPSYPEKVLCHPHHIEHLKEIGLYKTRTERDDEREFKRIVRHRKNAIPAKRCLVRLVTFDDSVVQAEGADDRILHHYLSQRDGTYIFPSIQKARAAIYRTLRYEGERGIHDAPGAPCRFQIYELNNHEGTVK